MIPINTVPKIVPAIEPDWMRTIPVPVIVAITKSFATNDRSMRLPVVFAMIFRLGIGYLRESDAEVFHILDDRISRNAQIAGEFGLISVAAQALESV